MFLFSLLALPLFIFAGDGDYVYRLPNPASVSFTEMRGCIVTSSLVNGVARRDAIVDTGS